MVTTPPGATRGPSSWVSTHKAQAGAGAAGAVVLVALWARSRKGSSAAATPATTSAYDSTGTDLYNSIEPQIQALSNRLGAMGSTSSGGSSAASPPPPATLGTTAIPPAGGMPAPVVTSPTPPPGGYTTPDYGGAQAVEPPASAAGTPGTAYAAIPMPAGFTAAGWAATGALSNPSALAGAGWSPTTVAYYNQLGASGLGSAAAGLPTFTSLPAGSTVDASVFGPIAAAYSQP